MAKNRKKRYKKGSQRVSLYDMILKTAITVYYQSTGFRGENFSTSFRWDRHMIFDSDKVNHNPLMMGIQCIESQKTSFSELWKSIVVEES